jgi:hypothetical protein
LESDESVKRCVSSTLPSAKELKRKGMNEMDYNSFPWSYEVTVVNTANSWRKTATFTDAVKALIHYTNENKIDGQFAILAQSRLGVVRGTPGL